MKQDINNAKFKFRASNILIALFCFVSVFAQENKLLQLDLECDQVYLMPYVSEYDLDVSVENDSIADLLFKEIKLGHYNGAYQRLFKLSLYSRDSIANYNFVSKLGNYATDLYLFYKDSKGKIVKNAFNYNDKTADKRDWIGEAVFPLPVIKGALDIYIIADYNSWTINEWYIYSNEGYSKHKTILSRNAIVYLVLVFVFLVLALVGYFMLRKRIIAYYAFYLFATSLYIFKELNTFQLQFLFEYPTILNFLNESIFGIFILSFILYVRSICDPKNSYSFEPLFYKILIALTVISIFLPSFIMDSTWSLVLSYLVNYGANVYFIIQTIPNFKKSIALRFFFLGILIIVILGLLMELHLYQVINFPAVFYWTMPGLILELLLIGIGIIYGFKLRSNELQEVKISNYNLNENIINLEKKIIHSKGAFQTLIANRGNGEVALSEEYLDYRLTQREIEVIQLLDKGYNNQELAKELFISRNTVKTHLKNIYKKLDVKDRKAVLDKMKPYGII